MINITSEHEGRRLDKVVQALVPALSFGEVSKLCRTGQIRLDGKRVKGNEKVAEGQQLRLPPQALAAMQQPAQVRVNDAEQEQWRQRVIYQDKKLLALNKPGGVPTQAGSKQHKSIDRIVRAVWPDDAWKLAHRLDKDTSGVLVLANGAKQAKELTNLFAEREVHKTYWAIVQGKVRKQQGIIGTNLAKQGAPGQQKMVVDPRGQRAETAYTVLAQNKGFSWVELHPKTGRTHQLRAHMGSIGNPIVGDAKYGATAQADGHMLLHARAINFMLPEQDEPMSLQAELPDVFAEFLEAQGWNTLLQKLAE